MIFSTFIFAIAASQGSVTSLTSCLFTTGIWHNDGQSYAALDCVTNLYSLSSCRNDVSREFPTESTGLASKYDQASLLPAAVAERIHILN